MPSSIHLGGITIHLYGLVLLLAVWAALLFSERRFREAGLDPEALWKLALLAIPFGIIGARIYHVSHYLGFYKANPNLIVAVWDGGLGIFGAILGGTLGIWLGSRLWHLESVLKVLDLVAPAITLGQVIGRWGNFFNREVIGRPTNLLWGIFIPRQLRAEEFRFFAKFHPVFAYESLLCLAIFFVLLWFESKRVDGEVFFLYILLYGLGRGGLEFLRIGTWKLGEIAVAQLFGIGFVVSAVVFFLSSKTYARRK